MGDFHRFALQFTALFALGTTAYGQITSYPFVERFDSVAVPALPPGWTTTTNRLLSGDFFSTTSSPRSQPNAVQSANSTIAQSLTSPLLDFANGVPDKLSFYIARSGTHLAGLLVEASVDSGTSFPISLSDTIRNPGTTSYVLTTIQLPTSLSGQPAVKIRWRILGGTGGTTGTFRIDDVSLTVLISFDLELASLAIQPSLLTPETPLTITAKIMNRGVAIADGYGAEFFLDSNGNGTGESLERFATQTGPPLSPNDSAEVSAPHPPLPPGEHTIIVAVSFSQDEVPSNNQSSATLTVGVTPGSVVVNEIMYAPSGDEPEWVELYNPSTYPINLRSWKISDSNVSTKAGITSSDLTIAPSNYVVIAKDSVFFSVRQNINVPVVITNFGALNNSSADAVVISDHRGIVIDSVYYSPSWDQAGKSLERIDPFGNSNDPMNWVTSIDSSGATAGRFNSQGRLDYDLTINRLTASGTALILEIANIGRQSASEWAVHLFADANQNGVGEVEEEIAFLSGSPAVQAGGTQSVTYHWTTAPQGESHLIAQLEFSPDQRLRNNTATAVIVISYSAEVLVINEIMYEPLSGQNEWVELFHRGSYPIDLLGWFLADRLTATGTRNSFPLSSGSLLVNPSDFVVIAAESTILNLFPQLMSAPNAQLIVLNRSGGFSLGNEGDDIVLYDLTGALIDSVGYSPSWHNPDVTDTRGRSLERINPELGSNDRRNWGTSARGAGGTPGARNSLFAERTLSAAGLSMRPNPFSPDGDGFEDVCIIQYNLPFSSSVMRVRIFDLRGRMIRLLVDAEPAGSRGEVVWDGFDDERRRARIGPHIVLIEAAGSGGTVSAKAVVVVATKL